MTPKPSGKQDAKPFNRSGTNQQRQFNKGKPFPRADARTARSAPAAPAARPASRSSNGNPATPGTAGVPTADEAKILFQTFFKSVGPRTYAAQVKEAKNGNWFIVLTEGKRDKETGDVRKTRVFVYSEDFTEFFKLLNDTAQYLRAHPVPEEIRAKRKRYWAKQSGEQKPSTSPANRDVKPPPMPTRGPASNR